MPRAARPLAPDATGDAAAELRRLGASSPSLSAPIPPPRPGARSAPDGGLRRALPLLAAARDQQQRDDASYAGTRQTLSIRRDREESVGRRPCGAADGRGASRARRFAHRAPRVRTLPSARARLPPIPERAGGGRRRTRARGGRRRRRRRAAPPSRGRRNRCAASPSTPCRAAAPHAACRAQAGAVAAEREARAATTPSADGVLQQLARPSRVAQHLARRRASRGEPTPARARRGRRAACAPRNRGRRPRVWTSHTTTPPPSLAELWGAAAAASSRRRATRGTSTRSRSSPWRAARGAYPLPCPRVNRSPVLGDRRERATRAARCATARSRSAFATQWRRAHAQLRKRAEPRPRWRRRLARWRCCPCGASGRRGGQPDSIAGNLETADDASQEMVAAECHHQSQLGLPPFPKPIGGVLRAESHSG